MFAITAFKHRYHSYFPTVLLLFLTLAFPCLSLAESDNQPSQTGSVNFDISSLLHSPMYGLDFLSFQFAAGNHSTLFFTKRFYKVPDSPDFILSMNGLHEDVDEFIALVTFKLRNDVPQKILDSVLNDVNSSFDILSQISSGITFHFRRNPETFRIFRSLETITRVRTKDKPTQLGVAYTEETMEMRIDKHQKFVGISDICHLKIQISKNKFPWSYGSFRDKMLPILKKHEKFVHDVNLGCAKYYQLRLMREDTADYDFVQWSSTSNIIDGSNFISREERRMYLLFASFALTFAKEENVQIILDSFHSADNFKTWMSEDNLRMFHNHELEKDKNGLIIPIIETSHYLPLLGPFTYRNSGYDKFLSDNYQLAQSRFKDLYIRGDISWSFETSTKSFYSGLTKPSDSGFFCAATVKSVSPINIQLGLTKSLLEELIFEDPGSVKKLFNGSTEQGENFAPDVVTIEGIWNVHNKTVFTLPPNNETKEFIQDSNVRFRCGIKVDVRHADTNTFLSPPVFATATRKYCEIFESGDGRTDVEVGLFIDRINSMNYFNTHILKILATIMVANRELQPWNVNIASIRIENTDATLKPSFYCTPERNVRNEFFSALINFAKVTKIPVKLQPVLGREWDVNYFEHLRTRRDLQKVSEYCPVFVSRNHFVQTVDNTWIPDPCLDRTDKVPDTGIQFHLNATGIILNLANSGLPSYNKSLQSNLTQDELKILMIFAFHKFNKVEVILPRGAYGISQLETLTEILTSVEFSELPEINNISKKSMYFDIDLNALLLKSDAEMLQKFQERMNGISLLSQFTIHFSEWETISEIKSVEVEPLRYLCNRAEKNFACGLTIKNCANEISNTFESLEYFTRDLQIRITYIVCVEQAVVASNADLDFLQEYLESHLYMKTMFQRAFPLISVHFCLQSTHYPTTLQDTQLSHFLRFTNDVDQFASLNHINYFLRQAIQTEQFIGWWRIDKRFENGSTEFDYANASAYMELESEFLKRDTWRPKFPEPILTSEYSITTIIGIIFGVIFFLVLGALLILALYLGRKLKSAKQLLSKQEVKNFFDGVFEEFGNEVELLPAGDGDSACMRMKYNRDLEIPLENIILGSVLGFGNFGVVRKATIGENTVAVKISKEECTAAVFKNFLMEVKIMFYVGNHENIVEFIGACTKSIQNGIIYIVMKMCENGSLESYLRDKLSVDQVSVKVYDLHRFCQEIASGMEFIASKKIIHGDLSTRNVLLDTNLTCKVADFGLARKLDENGEYVKTTDVGPWRWMAIESLIEKKFTTQSDIWSFGVTAWEIYSLGEIPYSEMKRSELIECLVVGYRLTCPDIASAEIYDKMMQCWNTSPDTRSPFSDLVNSFRQLRITEYN